MAAGKSLRLASSRPQGIGLVGGILFRIGDVVAPFDRGIFQEDARLGFQLSGRRQSTGIGKVSQSGRWVKRPDRLDQMVFKLKGLIAVREPPATRAPAPRLPVVAPEEVAAGWSVAGSGRT